MIFQPESACFETLSFNRTTIVSYRPSHLPHPPLELLSYGHELSSVLGRSQNLWLFDLQDTLGNHTFDAFEGETGLTLGWCADGE